VAEELGVTWRSAHEWHRAWNQGGVGALKAGAKPGPAPKFSDEEVMALEKELRRGALSHGYANELWTLPRVGCLVKETFERQVSSSEAWRLLRRMRWSAQKPERRARERDEAKIAEWKEVQWPRIKARARKEGRTLLFVDEPSGAR